MRGSETLGRAKWCENFFKSHPTFACGHELGLGFLTASREQYLCLLSLESIDAITFQP